MLFRFVPVFLAVIATTACTPPTRVVKRSALVPHAGPIGRSGHGMGDNLAELSIGTDTLASARAPELGARDVGMVSPRTQADIAARMRGRGQIFDFGLVYRRAFADDAYNLASDQPKPEDDASAYGFTFFASVPTENPRFRIGLGTELLVYSVPFVVYESCVEGCAGAPFTTVREDTGSVLGFALGVVPSYKLGRFTLSGSATARNHPVIDKQDVIVGFVGDVKGPEHGPLVLVFGAALGVDLGRGISATVDVHQTIGASPVDYGPTLSARLTLPLARR